MAALTHVRKTVQFSAVAMIPRFMAPGGAVINIMPHSPLECLTNMLSFETTMKPNIQAPSTSPSPVASVEDVATRGQTALWAAHTSADVPQLK